jgi:hypothetical protein
LVLARLQLALGRSASAIIARIGRRSGLFGGCWRNFAFGVAIDCYENRSISKKMVHF